MVKTLKKLILSYFSLVISIAYAGEDVILEFELTDEQTNAFHKKITEPYQGYLQDSEPGLGLTLEVKNKLSIQVVLFSEMNENQARSIIEKLINIATDEDNISSKPTFVYKVIGETHRIADKSKEIQTDLGLLHSSAELMNKWIKEAIQQVENEEHASENIKDKMDPFCDLGTTISYGKLIFPKYLSDTQDCEVKDNIIGRIKELASQTDPLVLTFNSLALKYIDKYNNTLFSRSFEVK